MFEMCRFIQAIRLIMLLLIMGVVFHGCRKTVSPENTVFESPVEPADALKTLELADDGLKIELFASEPLISDPAAMEIDEYGRIYVVEMPGYPLDTGGSGRVKLLEDTNGDGFPDKSTIFADSLVLPKGVMRWKKGILVTDAPHLYYLEDSNGDGKADIREVMLTGFARTNPQSNINKPLYGLDNWIYLANRAAVRTELFPDIFGDRGSEVRFAARPDGPVLPQDAGGRAVRFRPDSFELEMLSSRTQFGHDFDAWGRHFLISHNEHHIHKAISARYVDRNPDFPIQQVIHNTPVHGNAAEVFPITHNPEHQLLTDIGTMTSASSITWYHGAAFGPRYNNVTFIAESVHNIVHADVVSEKGSVFEARRLFEGVEFLASTDEWFRPVNFYVGPDGALYVLDYYRHIIEHPQWMDDEAIARLDLYAGIDRGRIYRISATDAAAPDWANNLKLGDASVTELVKQLENANMWWRRHAQRMLVDRQDKSAIEPLSRLLSDSNRPEARVHALWTLEGLGALTADQIRMALADTELGIRENAIRLAELHIGQNPGLVSDLLEMEDDPSARVRYQLLLTLGFFDEPEINETRKRILFRDIEDNWFQVAALSAPSARDEDMLGQTIAELAGNETPGRINYFRHVGAMVAAGGNNREIRNLIHRTAGDLNPESVWWQSAALEGLVNQIRRSNLDVRFLVNERGVLADAFFQTDFPEFRQVALDVLEVAGLPERVDGQPVLAKARLIATDRQAEDNFRADALRLIGIGDAVPYKQMLFDLVQPVEPVIVQRAALQVLADVPGDDVGEFILARWREMTPQVRDQALDVFMTSQSRRSMLLDAVEQNIILVSTIGWGRRVALMRHSGGDEQERLLREWARALLSQNPLARREVIEEYENAVLSLSGDRQRGRDVFNTSCLYCHQSGGEGVAFGPDAGTFRHWTPRALMTKILDPGRSIADGYEMWLVERHNGPPIAGVLVDETAESVTIRNPAGGETTVARSDIESIRTSNVSAMPEGLEQQINPQQMADLIEFIRRGQVQQSVNVQQNR